MLPGNEPHDHKTSKTIRLKIKIAEAMTINLAEGHKFPWINRFSSNIEG